MYNIIESLLTKSRFTRPKTKSDIKGIVVHWVANPNSTAIGNRNYFESLRFGQKSSNGSYIYASAHEIIDLNGDVIVCIPDDELAYHAGSRTYTNDYWDKYGISPNKCMYGIECTHIDWTGKMTESTYDSLINRCARLCMKYSLDPFTDIWTHKEVVGWKDCHLWFVNNPNDWKLFKQNVQSKIDLLDYAKVFPQWQIDCVNWLRDNEYITSLHLPDENITFNLFGYMMNNKLTKSYLINPIIYLIDNGYITSHHDNNELLTMGLFGYIVSHRLNESVGDNPVDYLKSKGIITSSWESNSVVNFWMIGAMLKNIDRKGLSI